MVTKEEVDAVIEKYEKICEEAFKKAGEETQVTFYGLQGKVFYQLGGMMHGLENIFLKEGGGLVKKKVGKDRKRGNNISVQPSGWGEIRFGSVEYIYYISLMDNYYY